MQYQNPQLQDLMDQLESGVSSVENYKESIFQTPQFKFMDAYYNELIDVLSKKGYSDPKNFAHYIMDKSKIEISNNTDISDDDLIKSAKHFANLTLRLIDVGNEISIPWLLNGLDLEFKID